LDCSAPAAVGAYSQRDKNYKLINNREKIKK
jgi:hypothetical protein